MKKLLVAVGAAATLAWCAQADVETPVSSVNFDDLTPGVLDKSFDDYGTGAGVLYWEDGADAVSVVTAYTEEGKTGNFLAVNEEDTLYRLMNGRGQSGTSVGTDAGVYFSSLVQFTAAEAENSSNLRTQGDKILIWLQGLGTGETNLIVTAADVNGDAQDYVIDNFTVDTTHWYALKVNAIAANEDQIAFTVTLKEDGAEGDATTLASGATTEFMSLVSSGNAKLTITKVGFQGTGSIDDLEFGTFAPDVVISPYMLYAGADPEGTASITYTVDGGEAASVTEDGVTVDGTATTLVVTAAPQTGYTVTGVLVNDEEAVLTGNSVTLTLEGFDEGAEITVVFTTAEGGDQPEPEGWAEDPTTVADQTAAEAYPSLTGTAVATAPADTLTRWAKANSVSFDTAAADIKLDAFLLNCANTDEAVAAARLEFKFTSITFDKNGNPVCEVFVPERGYNVVPKILGSQTLTTAAAAWHEKAAGDQFFKAVLSL